MQATEGAWTITRKVTEQVTTIGIDIGKNTFHLIDLDGRLRSQAEVQRLAPLRLLLGVKRTKSARKQTWRLERLLSGAKRTCRKVARNFRL